MAIVERIAAITPLTSPLLITASIARASTDLGKAASLASAGDVSLALKGAVNGRLDVDLNTPTRGEADITVLSKLVPKLPLAKTAGTGRFCATCGNGEPISDWFVVRNVKNGVSFYTNLVTGVSQFQAPGGI